MVEIGYTAVCEQTPVKAFDAYSATVTADDVASAVSCGPDVAAHVQALKEYADAGFTHVALVAVGAATLKRTRFPGSALTRADFSRAALERSTCVARSWISPRDSSRSAAPS